MSIIASRRQGRTQPAVPRGEDSPRRGAGREADPRRGRDRSPTRPAGLTPPRRRRGRGAPMSRQTRVASQTSSTPRIRPHREATRCRRTIPRRSRARASRTRWGRHAPPPGRGHRAPALRLPRGVSRRRAADPASKPREAPRARGRRGMESSPRKAHRSPGFRAQALVSRNSASPAYRRSFPGRGTRSGAPAPSRSPARRRSAAASPRAAADPEPADQHPPLPLVELTQQPRHDLLPPVPGAPLLTRVARVSTVSM